MPNGRTYREDHPAQPAKEVTPATPVVDPRAVAWSGINAAEALEQILGPQPDRRTGDAETDCKLAMAELSRRARGLKLWRALVLHMLYQLYKPNNDDVWLRVARSIGHKKPTVHNWAHPDVPDF